MALKTFYCITQHMPVETVKASDTNPGATITNDIPVRVEKHFFRGESEFPLKSASGQVMKVRGLEWTLERDDCYLYMNAEVAKQHMIQLDMLENNEMAIIEPIDVDEDLVYKDQQLENK